MNRRAMAAPVSKYCRAALSAAVAATLVLLVPACSSGTSDADAPLAGAKIGGPFTLVGKDGRTVRYSDFDGKYRILYFGYTFCPDICPTDLQNMMQGYRIFAKAHPDLASDVVPIFITVDPARDTPKVMGEYAANFGPQLVGLTGTSGEIAAAAKEWAVYYRKQPGTSPGSYLMDHSVATYLMGRDGKPLALLPADRNGKEVAAEMEKWIR
ncbi:MAG: SCO family protein [Sphingomonadales bacterium]|nr:SCO family protein [Sphingomonadales bacterium]MDE2570356.1 SCO family protein [Sphingomonadales bacterium]